MLRKIKSVFGDKSPICIRSMRGVFEIYNRLASTWSPTNTHDAAFYERHRCRTPRRDIFQFLLLIYNRSVHCRFMNALFLLPIAIGTRSCETTTPNLQFDGKFIIFQLIPPNDNILCSSVSVACSSFLIHSVDTADAVTFLKRLK